MATLATLVEWLASATGVRDAAAIAPSGRESEFHLRPLPNEEIYLWVKEMDNSRVVPQADPRAAGACWKFIGVALLTASLLVGVLVPFAYNLLAGYQIHALEKQREGLLRERAELELRQARLLSPDRLAELARLQQLVDPPPESFMPLPPKAAGAYAMNR